MLRPRVSYTYANLCCMRLLINVVLEGASLSFVLLCGCCARLYVCLVNDEQFGHTTREGQVSPCSNMLNCNGFWFGSYARMVPKLGAQLESNTRMAPNTNMSNKQIPGFTVSHLSD